MTKIFNSYDDFLKRENVDDNGVSVQFADEHPNYVTDNESNSGCWNCSGCSGCSDCSRCSDCSGCSGCSRCSGLKNARPVEAGKENKESVMGNYPVIEKIHQKVLEAASKQGALKMDDWHTCETTHCRAGWVVHLAGPAGYALEKETSTPFAAMQIYDKSSQIKVSPTRFFESNEIAMADMVRCAEEEKQLSAAK